jgi:hypothetical protein
MTPNPKPNRRSVLRGSLRVLAAGTIVAGSAGLVVKRQRLLKDGRCVNRSICKDCVQLTDCGLPRARSYRKATEA